MTGFLEFFSSGQLIRTPTNTPPHTHDLSVLKRLVSTVQ